MSRRRMISWMAASACCSQTGTAQKPESGNAVHIHKTPQLAADPKPAGILNLHDMDSVRALSERIIPADAHSPGAAAAGVDGLINDILSVSPDSRRKLWKDGLHAVDEMARAQYGRLFSECSADQQIAILTRISENEEHPVTIEEQFFVEVKQSTVDCYYRSKTGIHQELRYEGNAVLAEFPGCQHEEHKSK